MNEMKLKSALNLSLEEKIVDRLKLVKLKEERGSLFLTNKQIIFAKEKGIFLKSFLPQHYFQLSKLQNTGQLGQENNKLLLDDHIFSIPELNEAIKFKDKIFEQIQILRGLVKYKEKWITSEQKFEYEQKDRGLIKYENIWMSPEGKENLQLKEIREEFEKQQEEKGLVKYKGRWGRSEQIEQWKKVDLDLATNFKDQTPYGFEKFIAKLFERMGYKVEVTPISNDFGADVIARNENEKIVIQVKKYSPDNNVGVGDVNQVIGAMHFYGANRAIVVTTSDFTEQALKISKRAPVEFWNRNKLRALIEKYCLEDISAESRPYSQKNRRSYEKGFMLISLGRLNEAIDTFKTISDSDPGDADALNITGILLSQQNKFKEALKCFVKVMEIQLKIEIPDLYEEITDELLSALTSNQLEIFLRDASNTKRIFKSSKIFTSLENSKADFSHILITDRGHTCKYLLIAIFAVYFKSRIKAISGLEVNDTLTIFYAMLDIDLWQKYNYNSILFIDSLDLSNLEIEIWMNLFNEGLLKDDSLKGRKIEINSKKHIILYNAVATKEPFTIIGSTESSEKLSDDLKELFLKSCIRMSICRDLE